MIMQDTTKIYMFFLKFLFLLFFLSSFRLADRLYDAKEGDYIVTEQNKNYSVLIVRENNPSSLLLEEVSIPSHLISNDFSWTNWVKTGAKNHTSWIQYQIDPSNWQLVECYSYSKKGWLYRDPSEQFLSQLLSLPLTKILQEDRKRVGPAPIGEEDHRPLWNPSLLVQGKKTKILCEAWKTRWPHDNSALSSCEITLYFPPQEISSFPLWIEASNGHFHYAIRVVSAGKHIESPIPPSLPKRPPQFLKPLEKTETALRIPMKIPSYYKQKKLSLFLLDLFHVDKKIGPIPFAIHQGTDVSFLEISLQIVKNLLNKNHHYKWILVIEGEPLLELESEELFSLPSLKL